MCPSTTPVADDDEADELLPPPPPPLAAADAAAAEEAPLADAALPEDDAAVEEVAPHTSNRRAYGCSTARRPAALLQWISRMPETFAPAAFRTFRACVEMSRFVAALYGSRHAPPVDLDFAKLYSRSY